MAAIASGSDDIPEWKWELNGAGDPSQIWVDGKRSDTMSKPEFAIDSGFETGSWVMRLDLPEDLDEVADDMDPIFIAMGLANAERRLAAKLAESVRLCLDRRHSWESVALAMGMDEDRARARFEHLE